MEEFLKVVYYNYADNETENGIAVSEMGQEIFTPLKEELKRIVSPEIYNRLEEVMSNCIYASDEYYAVKGMALSIRIMNKEYISYI